MSLSNTPSSYEPNILSGPFGSLLAQKHGVSTQQAFRDERADIIRAALRSYRDSGVTQPVTPTFGAAARGPHGGEFTSELRAWNTAAAYLTHDTFPGSRPFGSVAPLLDTSGHHDATWKEVPHQVNAARRIHVPQLQALRDGDIRRVLAEAVHDCHEAVGLVLAARETGMDEIIVSFEPTKQGLPNQASGFGSYGEILEYLHEVSGNTKVGIGLNCGNAGHIFQIVGDEKPGTFSAIYPNKAAIPEGDAGHRFRELGDKNDQRTSEENTEFATLCALYDVSAAQLQRMIALCGAKGVENIGLCCGSSPEDVATFRQFIATRSDGQL